MIETQNILESDLSDSYRRLSQLCRLACEGAAEKENENATHLNLRPAELELGPSPLSE